MSEARHLLEVGVRWPPETFLRWKLEGLAARGMRVTVASRSVFDPDARLRGVELLDLSAPGAHEALAALRPAVAHFEWPGAAARFLDLFDVWGCPVVASIHGHSRWLFPVGPDDPEPRRLREVIRRATLVHCVSDSLRDRMLEHGCDPARIRVIRQGVDPSVFAPAPEAEPDVLRLVGVAWLRWMKGYEWALEAVRRLVDEEVPVALEVLGATAGESANPERRRVLHTIADLGLEEHVRLEPGVGSREVARRLRRASALLLPSLSEGLPTVVLEAMACGVPVVATDCGGVSEAVTDGVEGLLAPPRDPEALAQALARLWRDPGLRARMGAAGRRTAVARFTLERQLDEFQEMYARLPAAGTTAPHARPAVAGREGPRAGRVRLLSAGRLGWEQGFEHSVQAVRMLIDRGVDCDYRILGEGEHAEAVAFARRQLGLESRVALLGAYDAPRLDSELGSADVFVDPAVAAVPSAVARARSRGVPCVTTANGVRRRDPGDLAGAIARAAGAG